MSPFNYPATQMSAAQSGISSSYGGGEFPLTRQSVIGALDAPDVSRRRAAWEVLIGACWRPVYVYLRRSWQLEPADAEEVTQEFFARALEGGVLERFEPGRARFRTYLRVCLDRFTSNTRKAEGRLRRGGGAVHLSLDFADAECYLELTAPDSSDADGAFRDEVIRSLFAAAAKRLREDCARNGKSARYALFERYDLHDRQAHGRPPTYAQLAAEFDIPVTQVTNYLAAMRRAFRSAVLEELRAITADDAEFRAEARELFGIDV